MVPSNNNHQSRHFRQELPVQLQNLPYLIKIAVALFGISIALTRVDGGHCDTKTRKEHLFLLMSRLAESQSPVLEYSGELNRAIDSKRVC